MKPLIFFLSLVATFASAQPVSSRNLSGPGKQDIAIMYQEGHASGGSSASIKVGPIAASNRGYGVNHLVTRFSGSPFGTMPGIVVSDPTSQENALAAAKRWMGDNANSFARRYGQWLNEQGISQGLYHFSQPVNISTEAGIQRRALSFTMTVDNKGRPTYGVPKLVNPNPLILDAQYIPLRAGDGLPSNWKFPEAGYIKYRLLDKRFEPITNWVSVNVGGAFDAPAGGSEAAVACLMDRVAASCSAPTDIRTIMGHTGADSAIVTYVNQMEPVYDDSNPDEQVAKAAVSVDSREWNCKTYDNKGSFGFVLELSTERYFARLSAESLSYEKIGQWTSYGISPTEPYEKSIDVRLLGNQHPDPYVINPLPDSTELIRWLDPKSRSLFTYVAPVIFNGGNADDIVFTPSSGSWRATKMSTDPASGTSTYYLGTYNTNTQWTDSGKYTGSFTFNVGSVDMLQGFFLRFVHYDDHLRITVNGQQVFIGPYGGSMLEYITGSSHAHCVYASGRWGCGSYSIDPKTGNSTFIPSVYYNNCSAYGSEVSSGYMCWNGPCSPETVQYSPSGSCRGADAGDYDASPNIDLKPYLRQGSNTIQFELVVGYRGEAYAYVEAKGCGNSFALDLTAPVAPSRDGIQQQLNDIVNKLK
jgi:hypothetical protein